MDAVLIIDKPQGLTSHDVVAVARRALREPRIGHTGTLDPLATGVLPLAIGRATRLVRFLTASDKDYDADIRFGATTDSYDVTGNETYRTDAHPTRDQVEEALGSLRGEYLQLPPPYSAKKIEGRRAYALARNNEPVELKPVPVNVTHADLVEFTGWTARVRLTVSAGFYVRAFAHRLGELVATGAFLQALQRTRSGEFRIEEAMSLDALQEGREAAAEWVIPMDRLLTGFPAVRVTEEGRVWIGHGRELSPAQWAGEPDLPAGSAAAKEHPPAARGPEAGTSRSASGAQSPEPVALSPQPEPSWVRLLDRDGHLLALATPGSHPGSLHPSVVLN